MIEKFDARDARNLTDQSIFGSRLKFIIDQIKIRAEKGHSVLHYYEPLHQKTINELEARFFIVEPQSQIAIQKDKLYYTISW